MEKKDLVASTYVNLAPPVWKSPVLPIANALYALLNSTLSVAQMAFHMETNASLD